MTPLNIRHSSINRDLSARLLHIETSSLPCSVAVSENATVVASLTLEEKHAHSRALVPMIHEILARLGMVSADLAAVSVSNGPGSYTGLRVGLSTAKGICYASDLPLIAVDTLESLADQARELFPGFEQYISVLDARRMDAYFARFRVNGDRIGENQFATIDRDLIAGLSSGAGADLDMR